MPPHGLTQTYKQQADAIQHALERFQNVGMQDETTLFAELCFCLCTPQSKAHSCDNAIKTLVQKQLLSTINTRKISTILVQNGVRFHNNKARYIVNARTLFQNGTHLKELLAQYYDTLALREWLVQNVKGLGYKESSHYLRNIGRGEKLAILDRHILRNLFRYKVIRTLPKTLTKKSYLTIEKKLHRFATATNIPPAALDLLWWSQETGEIFK